MVSANINHLYHGVPIRDFMSYMAPTQLCCINRCVVSWVNIWPTKAARPYQDEMGGGGLEQLPDVLPCAMVPNLINLFINRFQTDMVAKFTREQVNDKNRTDQSIHLNSQYLLPPSSHSNCAPKKCPNKYHVDISHQHKGVYYRSLILTAVLGYATQEHWLLR
jgi:hypothetical protein